MLRVRTALCVAIGVTVAIVGTGVALHAAGTDGRSGSEPPVTTPPDVTVVPSPARRTGAVRPERPRGIRLPSGIGVPVRPAETRPDGLLDVPADIRAAGWWKGGSRLGDPFGSVLLAGHVDSVTQGLGPYAELLSLRGGERVRVRSRHLEQWYVVRSLSLVPQGRLRRGSPIYSVSGRHRLTLVTCAPPYDRARGGYQRLAIVTARPVGPVEERS
jgi:hypothetical protein